MKKFILFSSFFVFSFITGLIGVINHGNKSVIACVYGPSGECVDTWYMTPDWCGDWANGCNAVVGKCDWDPSEYSSVGCEPENQSPCETTCN